MTTSGDRRGILMEGVTVDILCEILLFLEPEDIHSLIRSCKAFRNSERVGKLLKEKSSAPVYILRKKYGLVYPEKCPDDTYPLPKDLDPKEALDRARELSTYFNSIGSYPTVNAFALLVGHETEENRKEFTSWNSEDNFPYGYLFGEASTSCCPNVGKEYCLRDRVTLSKNIQNLYIANKKDLKPIIDKIYKSTLYVLPKGVVSIPFDADYTSIVKKYYWQHTDPFVDTWLDSLMFPVYMLHAY